MAGGQIVQRPQGMFQSILGFFRDLNGMQSRFMLAVTSFAFSSIILRFSGNREPSVQDSNFCLEVLREMLPIFCRNTLFIIGFDCLRYLVRRLTSSPRNQTRAETSAGARSAFVRFRTIGIRSAFVRFRTIGIRSAFVRFRTSGTKMAFVGDRQNGQH